MGSKNEVYDIEADVEFEPEHPLDPVVALLRQQMDADRHFAQALWYGYGRLANEPMVARDERDTEESYAWSFGMLYQRMMLAFTNRERRDTVAIAEAWENYRRSAGGTIDAI